MNKKEEDAAFQGIYDLLIYNPKFQTIDYENLKIICQETWNVLTYI